MKKLKVLVSIAMIASCMTGMAATKRTTTKKVTAKKSVIGMANPASEFCVKNGGESTIVKSKNGEFGVCKLKDGTTVEEWEYYRENNKKETKEPEKMIGTPNPASVFCEKHGGKSINVKDKDGNETGKCQFKDGTKVDEWHSYRENN